MLGCNYANCILNACALHFLQPQNYRCAYRPLSVRILRAFRVIMEFALFRVPRQCSAPKRAFARLQLVSILVVLAIFAAISRRASGYALEGQHWPAGTVVTFQMGLGSAGRTLIDSNTSWDNAAAAALSALDNVLASLRDKSTFHKTPVFY